MSFVSNAVKGVTGALFGSQGAPTNIYGTPGQQEQNLVGSSLNNLNSLYGQQTGQASQDQQSASNINNLFQQHLVDFLSSSNQGSNPTPEQIAQAQNFVDQTFTNPNQTALNQYNSQFQDQMNAKAAALGRSPNADTATQQAVYGEGLRQTQNLQNERSSRITDFAQNLNNQDFGRQQAGVQAGMQGSGFLNGLTQQAFQNQLGLLNGNSQFANYFQRNRQTNGQPTQQPGLFGTVSSGLGQISDTISAGQGLGTQIGNIGGGSGSYSRPSLNDMIGVGR